MLGLAPKKSLACGFCGKSETNVDRLLGGRRGNYICDACVSVCNRVLTAAPVDFKGWSAMSDEALLGALPSAEAAVDGARHVLQAQIDELRARNVSWQAIGTALGISRQSAWERFS
ncbi:MAG: ClpX C4-type zinc finger protein [Pseudomonadota bacterium]